VIIVFDVGNTETTIGLFDKATLRAHWRIMTDVPRTADEFGVLLSGLLEGETVDRSRVGDVSIGSVVPRVTSPLTTACEQWLEAKRITVIDGSSPLPIRLDVEEPRTVGADRIVNTLAASRLFGRDAVVVDLGTATTFDCITADGVFIGGVIAPGVMVMAATLFRRTSKLPATELVPPKQVIGKNTEECIRAGVMLGAAELIDGIVRRIKEVWPGGEPPMVIATGGLADTFAPLCRSFEHVDPFLTLQGLRIAHELLVGGAAD
jgi:type III pantothenate kinase